MLMLTEVLLLVDLKGGWNADVYVKNNLQLYWQQMLTLALLKLRYVQCNCSA